MTKHNERADEVKATGEEAARGPWRLRTQVIPEAVVAAIPEAPRREPRAVSEEEEAEAAPEEGRADDEAGAGA